MAINSGADSVPLRTKISDDETPFVDEKHRLKFLGACHRGFEKAQNQMVALLDELQQETNVEETRRIQLVIRKIADAIAVQMVGFRTHVMRRFSIHDIAPAIDLCTIKLALKEANRLNAESRQTFALLADLTTFIHVADIFRVDFRREYKISLIELKSGRVNDHLLSTLENYKPDPLSLERIKNDPKIEPGHQKQAKRMLTQRIRLHRAEEVIARDEGIDPQRGVPIHHSGPTIEIKHYDSLVGKVCDDARLSGYGAVTIDSCLHIGAGYAEDMEIARKRAFHSVDYAVSCEAQKNPEGFALAQQEVIAAVGPERDDNYKIVDLALNNSHSIATRPFLMWEIPRPHILSMISQNLRILAVFNLQKFFWLARQKGATLQFASRRQTEEAKAKVGTINVMTWRHRGILYQYGERRLFFTTGLYSRIVNELMTPLQLIREMLVPTPDQVASIEAWIKKTIEKNSSR